MSQHETSLLKRRALLKGLGTAAGIASTLAMPGASQAASQAAGEPPGWDREADIVCVGSGAAALSAAVTALSLGNQVVVVEKSPVFGGTTGKSGGVMWIPNHHLLRAQGIQDSKADCLRYMARYASPETYNANAPLLGLDPADYRRLEAFYDHGSAMLEHLRKIGVLDFETFTIGTPARPPSDYGAHLPENKVPRGRALVPTAPSGSSGSGSVASQQGTGRSLVTQLEGWLGKRGAELLTDHRVLRVVQAQGRVVGVEAHDGEKTVRIRARKAVIFGSGGYAHNTALVHEHQKALHGSCALLSSTGDFISIAQAAGARMGDLGTAWRTQVVLEEALVNRAVGLGVFFAPGDSMIIVNKYGRRVVNEKSDYNDRTAVHFQFDPVRIDYPNQALFMVFDRRTLGAYAGAFPLPPAGQSAHYVIEAADLTQLGARLQARLAGMAHKIGDIRLAAEFAATLRLSIQRFNSQARMGRDDDFHRGLRDYDRDWQQFFSPVAQGSPWPANRLPNATLHPLQEAGPYYAIILGAGALDTSAGPQINEHAQVLDAGGKPMPGLYGAGNCIASPTREAYLGAGGTIGPAMTFGFIAAQHAHRQGTAAAAPSA
jgi:3-oxosteroid 1-dehydrogenase